MESMLRPLNRVYSEQRSRSLTFRRLGFPLFDALLRQSPIPELPFSAFLP